MLKKESRDRKMSPAEAVLGQALLCTALGMKLPQACGCSTQEGLFAVQNWTAHLWERAPSCQASVVTTSHPPV